MRVAALLSLLRLRITSSFVDRRVRRGDLSAALGLAQRALRQADRLPRGQQRQERRATMLNTIGYLRLQLGDLAGAAGALTESLEIEESIDASSPQTALRLSNLAAVAYAQGALEEARMGYERAVALREAIEPNSIRLAADLSSLGQVLAHLGQLGDAQSHYDQALEITSGLEPSGSAHAGVLTNKATLLLNRGELDEARWLFWAALEIETALDPRSTESATAWSNLGLVSEALREAERALGCFRQALAIDRTRAPDAPQTAVDHNNVAIVLLDLDRPDEAIEHLTEALRIEHQSASAGTASALYGLGYAHQLAGRAQQAADHYRQALAADAAISRLSRDVGFDLAGLGTAEHQLGQHEDATHLLRQAAEMFELLALPAELSRCRTNLATVLHEQGSLDEAIACAERACEAAEQARSRAGHPETRELLFALHHSAFALLLDLLHERRADGDGDRIFSVAEAARARTLGDLLGERGLRPAAKVGRYASLLEQERILQRALLDRRAELAEVVAVGGREPQVEQASAAVNRVRDELEECRHQLRRAEPVHPSAAPRPVSADQARRRLSADTLLLCFAAGAERLHLWAGRQQAVEQLTLPASPNDVAALVARTTAAYRRGEPGGTDELSAQRALAAILLGGIPDRLMSGVRRMIVVPSGELFHMPVELLPWRDGVLADAVAVSYAPSVAVLYHGIRSQGSASRRFAGYAPTAAEAPLPAARAEILRVAEVFGASHSDIHVGATKQRVVDTISDASRVFFASHGVLDDEEPLHSGLWCTPTGAPDEDPVLRGYELLDVPIGADLVVCSACESGLGRLRTGEGLVGLSRALFFAGARCLVLSLWPMSDVPTRRLVVRFAELIRDGQAPAQALWNAKAHMRAEHPKVYATPWTWAGLVAIGDAGGWSVPQR